MSNVFCVQFIYRRLVESQLSVLIPILIDAFTYSLGEILDKFRLRDLAITSGIEGVEELLDLLLLLGAVRLTTGTLHKKGRNLLPGENTVTVEVELVESLLEIKTNLFDLFYDLIVHNYIL